MRAIRHDPRSKPQKSPAKMGHHLHLSVEGYAKMFVIRLADSDPHTIRRTPRLSKHSLCSAAADRLSQRILSRRNVV